LPLSSAQIETMPGVGSHPHSHSSWFVSVCGATMTETYQVDHATQGKQTRDIPRSEARRDLGSWQYQLNEPRSLASLGMTLLPLDAEDELLPHMLRDAVTADLSRIVSRAK
jgi:hypothetical protein